MLLEKNVVGKKTDWANYITLSDEHETPMLRVLPKGRLSDTKYVTMTNVCEIGFTFDSHTGKIILTGAIDNLTKGASGQAVQCMNIRFGFEETDGLL